MNFYSLAFLFLVSGCGILTFQQYRSNGKSPEKQALLQVPLTPEAKIKASNFYYLFLIVYCLVMGADWLQGNSISLFIAEIILIFYRTICIQLIQTPIQPPRNPSRRTIHHRLPLRSNLRLLRRPIRRQVRKKNSVSFLLYYLLNRLFCHSHSKDSGPVLWKSLWWHRHELDV